MDLLATVLCVAFFAFLHATPCVCCNPPLDFFLEFHVRVLIFQCPPIMFHTGVGFHLIECTQQFSQPRVKKMLLLQLSVQSLTCVSINS